ncbi:MAG: pseudouridine synthase [Planctomycetota bacterium]|jgi:23S rRNA-/tRNA-specific pseudouridylate synthase
MPIESDQTEEVPRLVVPAGQSSSKVLEFVSSCLVNESKAALRRLIASGAIKVNGSAVSTATTLRVGDVVSLPQGLNVSPPPAQSMAIEVLYEDDAHLCVNKPSGWPVLPTRAGGADGFYRSVIGLLNRDAPPGGPYRRPHFVHRLDRDTSGVLLVAKTVDAGRALSSFPAPSWTWTSL